MTHTQLKLILVLEYLAGAGGFFYLSYHAGSLTMWLGALLLSVGCFFMALTSLGR